MTTKILIVEDDADSAGFLRILLEREGYLVQTAATAKRALEELPSWKPEIILMDLMLPKIDGVRATSLLKARDPQSQVVVLTGVTSQEKVHEALERGARFSFTKPLNFAELLNVVESLRKNGRR